MSTAAATKDQPFTRPARRNKFLTLRYWMLQLHLWLGLAVALSFTLVGLSGSMLMLEKWADDWRYADVMRVEPEGQAQPFQQVLGTFRQQYPDARLQRVIPPASAGHSWVMVIASTQPRSKLEDIPAPQLTAAQWRERRIERGNAWQRVFVDPYSLVVSSPKHSGIRTPTYVFFEHMHYYLLLDTYWGYQMNGWLGVATLVVLATGLVLWWPTTIKLFLTRIWVKWHAPWSRINWDLHNAIGFWSLPLLVIAMVTGLYFPFHDAARKSMAWLMDAERKSPPQVFNLAPAAPGTPPATLEAMLANLAYVLPEAQVDSIFDIEAVKKPIRITVREKRYGIYYNARVTMDRATGQVASINRPGTPHELVQQAIVPLHEGYFVFPFMRILYFLIGLAPLVLAVTGIWIWLKRKLKQWRSPGPAAKSGLAGV